MKNTILIAFVAGLAFVACKKDRTCTCTLTAVSSTVNGVTVPVNTGLHTSVTKIDKVTKKGAACNSGDRTTTSSTTSGSVTTTQVDVDKADCKLD